MTLRNILLAALVLVPLASSPAPVSAQEQGLARAADATAQAESVGGWKNCAPKEPKELPPGVNQVFGDGQLLSDGQNLPPGISRTRDVSSDQSGGGDDDCDGWVLVQDEDGSYWLEDCDGNRVRAG